MRIHVDPDDLAKIREILRTENLLEFTFAFGSRVRGDHRPFSDLDLLIKATQPLTIQQLAKLQGAFSSSDIPFQVDIVDWHMISDDFKTKIVSGMIPLG